ncbi:Hint domain-containing protein [Jannaschia sp. M317]|uniref:Hint domain-containing protein n=1 Tax=Jannaschia sp. M317 TaxID=2867011 RepID=UPI0021A8B912|nr:Hint domain-containing protein [Jannaschia sp. M317]UWQ16204.1 Hint domain-containing protein [Jannaschia sp. M317]
MTVQLRMNADQLRATSCLRVDVISDMPRTGGLARGTKVETDAGPVAVQDLRPGDMIQTHERGFCLLLSVSRRHAPVCRIRTDSLGLARPARDILVASDQHIVLSDWRAEALFDMGAALVPTARLADGHQIATLSEAEVYQLDLGSALTIQANGLDLPVGRSETGVVDAIPDA